MIRNHAPRAVTTVIFLLLIIPSTVSTTFAPTTTKTIASTQPTTATPDTVPVYEITTRGNSADPVLPNAVGVQGNGYNDKYPLADIQQLFNNCPGEIAIVVHGWNLTELQAKERFDRVKMSLSLINIQFHLLVIVGCHM